MKMLTSLAAATLMSLTLAAPVGALAQGKQDFSLVNRTGYTISEVYVSPSASNDWEEDVLGRDVLSNGETVHITFSRGTKSCHWDLKVVFDDSEEAEWEKFDLCTVSKISLSYDRNKGTTWADYE
ncbi:hypothetical protein [Azospirillum halopraeferens]|uniref:hypothetical protein n=1 Tax=Azospirillum halopraeferens TaxID=34010 RepID=UPI000409B993|nr:hypothetical protein [Azospirillum halopraeferens]